MATTPAGADDKGVGLEVVEDRLPLARHSRTPADAVSDVVAEFRAAMAAGGVPTDDPIVADGQRRRVHVEGDRAAEDRWYVAR